MSVGPENPAYAEVARSLDDEWARMTSDHVALERPVIVLGGWHAWPTMAERTRSRLIRLTSGEQRDVLNISYPIAVTIGGAADESVRRIDRRCPSGDPNETVEVDVVAISMGGIIAREAALTEPLRGTRTKRLKIRHLFTLASPHRGARLAGWVFIDPASWDLRPGSGYLAALDERERDYELIPYAQLRDTWVGATHAAPPGECPIWTRGTLMFSHFAIPTNRLVLADIARRLRGEEPLLTPGDPPPHD